MVWSRPLRANREETLATWRTSSWSVAGTNEKYDELPDLAAETEVAIAEQQGFRFWATMAKLPTSVPHFPNGLSPQWFPNGS